MAASPKPNAVTEMPTWAEGPAANVVPPPSGKSLVGWLKGEKPPARYWNWLMRSYGRWIAYVNTLEQNSLNWLARQFFTFGATISRQAGDTNPALNVTGGGNFDTVTASGQVAGASGSFTSASVSGTAQVGTVATNTLQAQSGRLVTMPGMNLKLTSASGGGGDITAQTGFIGQLSADTYTGRVAQEALNIVPAGSLLNGWTGVATGGYVAYAKNALGQTIIDVRSMYGGKGGLATPLTIIPAAYRPPPGGSYVYGTNVFSYVSGTTGQINVAVLILDSDGKLYLSSGALNGITVVSPGFYAWGAGVA